MLIKNKEAKVIFGRRYDYVISTARPPMAAKYLSKDSNWQRQYDLMKAIPEYYFWSGVSFNFEVPPLISFVCDFAIFCLTHTKQSNTSTSKHTNTQTHKHTNTKTKNPIFNIFRF